MAIRKGYEEYQKQSILNLPTHEIVLKLYDQAQKLLEEATIFYEKEAFSEGMQKIMKTKKIFVLLRQSLDMEMKLGRYLNSIYCFLDFRMNASIVSQNVQVLQEILPVLYGLKETWGKGIQPIKENKGSAE